jgi:predicted DNA-binding transcriptional regulator AlpA
VEHNERLILPNQLSAYVPYGPQRFRQLAAEGRAPAPIRISSRRVAWRERDLREWVARKIAEAV